MREMFRPDIIPYFDSQFIAFEKSNFIKSLFDILPNLFMAFFCIDNN